MDHVHDRLKVISGHLAAVSGDMLALLEVSLAYSKENLGQAVKLGGTLKVIDERNGKEYVIKVMDDGTVRATEFKQIKYGNNKGLKLYDPGYLNTAPARSSICYIDGDKSILQYRGYSIEDLAKSSTFPEVAYLLIYGSLPSQHQLADWEYSISQHSAIPNSILKIIEAAPKGAHPMGVLISAMSKLSVLFPDANPAINGQDTYKSRQLRNKQIVRILGMVPTIVANICLILNGNPHVLPSKNRSYTENFLYMLDSKGDISYKPCPQFVRILDILFILHAEHEMNCSTAAARHLASSGVDIFTALAGAVGALCGPLNAGANEAVYKMLEEIKTIDNIPQFIEGVKNRKRKMPGFGHRVYKNYDPRVNIVRQLIDKVSSISSRHSLLEVAIALEKAALADKYFSERKLYPNVQFYSAIFYSAMGFEEKFFTMVFAIPRMAGFLAHWQESLDDPDTKIMRPQQVYSGESLRNYVHIEERMKSTEGEKLVPLSTVKAPQNALRRQLAGSRL